MGEKKQAFLDPALLTPHFSTRIYKGYLFYLRNKFGLERAKKIIRQTGLTWDYLTTESNWVSETFAENFYRVLEQQEGIDPDYSYQAARLSMSKESQGPVQLLAIRLFDPKSVFKRIIYFSRQYNKVDQLNIEKLKSRNLTLTYTCRRDTEYFHQIVESWRGFLSHTPALMGLPLARVEVDETDHNTATFRVSWVANSRITLLLYLQVLLCLGGLGILFLLAQKAFFPFIEGLSYSALWLSFLGTSMTFLLSFIYRRFLNDQLFGSTQENFEKILKEAEDRYNDLFIGKEKLDRRYKEANLLTKVIQRINSSIDRATLIDVTLKEIKESLDYDRVIYMKFNKKSNLIQTDTTVGFDDRVEKLLREYSIDLSLKTSSELHLGNVFRSQKSILIPVTSDYFNSLSEEGKLMLYITRSKSFLAVPVTTEKTHYGLMLVDYVREEKQLTQDDVHIIQNVANQLAVSMQNSENLEKEKRLRMTFQQFVPPQVMNSLLGESSGKFEKGQEKVVTILFSDLRDFTKNSTQMDPSSLVEALNQYLKEMTEIVYRHGGIVDKFLGDGLLAIFNAFEDTEDHCIRAAQVACEMQRTLPRINEYLAKEVFKTESGDPGTFQLNAGVAIHTGPVILGMMGTRKKFEFTAIGETVNIASRLVGLTKLFGSSSIIISDEVKENLFKRFVIQGVGSHEIRGTSKRKELHLIVGEALPSAEPQSFNRTSTKLPKTAKAA